MSDTSGSPARVGHFDADTYAAAQQEPELVIGACLYRGRLLSIDEWLVYAEQYDRLLASKPTVKQLQAFYRRYMRAVFPRSRFRWWAPDPVKGLFRLPWSAVQEAFKSFFELQALASIPSASRSASRMSGTSSAPSSTEAGPIEAIESRPSSCPLPSPSRDSSTTSPASSDTPATAPATVSSPSASSGSSTPR